MALLGSCSKPLLFSSKEVLLIIFCSATVHLFNFYGDLHLVSSIYYLRHLYLLVTVFQGAVFLCFPLLGLAADVLLNRYRAVCIGVLLTFAAAMLTTVLAIVDIATNPTQCMVNNTYQDTGVGDGITDSACPGQDSSSVAYQVVAGIALLVGSLGEGLFEANAIQFAADQMMDAPSVEVSTMIHWYCWSRLLLHTFIYNAAGSLLLFCFGVVCQPIYVLLYVSLAGIALSSVSLTLLIARRREFAVHPIGINPLKQICRVLAYAISHPQPVRRSAFTYCDNRPPTQLDYGKIRFGGPFTEEEIEDTRVFLWMCLLICTLVGYNLAGDTYLFGSWMEYMGYSTRISCLIFGIDSENFSHLVVLVGVPFHQLIVAPRTQSFEAGMLRRLGVGLILTLTAVLSIAFSEAMLLDSIQSNGLPSDVTVQSCSSLILDTSMSSHNSTSNSPAYLYILAIPQFFKGLAYMFVFITALEFICAQTPNALKGTLIGFWYSLQSLQYLLMGLIDQLQVHRLPMVETTGWYIYQISKALAILVSAIFFMMVADKYRYRQRGEQYYQQVVIESIYERELDLAKRLEDEHAHFIHTNPYHIYSGRRHW